MSVMSGFFHLILYKAKVMEQLTLIELFQLINVSAYLPNFVLSSLIPQTLPYSAKLSMAALVAHLLSLKVSRTRRSLPDLVALVLWYG